MKDENALFENNLSLQPSQLENTKWKEGNLYSLSDLPSVLENSQNIPANKTLF